jgi:hypothetical protein
MMELPRRHATPLQGGPVEPHDANETAPCSLNMARHAQRYKPAVCAGITIQPLRIRMVTASPAELTRDSRSERPLPADFQG